MGLLDEKVAIVTGAGRGIGKAVALLFAREGARIVVNDTGTDRGGSGADESVASAVADEIRNAGGHAVPSTVDASSPEGAERVVRAAVGEFGRLDVLVSLAGIRAEQSFLKTEEATLERMLDVSLRGPLFLTQNAAREMIKAGRGGRIVLTTGAAGLVGNVGQTAYSITSAAIYGLMRTASIELQRQGVMVNAVAPVAKTRLTEDLPLFEHVDSMTAEHVAPAYLFLASDLADGVTGNVLAVAGGRISQFKIAESAGRFQEAEGGVWTAHEIREQWNTMAKLPLSM